MNSTTTFVESDNHRIARELLGPDFHGIDAVEEHFGPLPPEQRQTRRELRLRDHRTGELLSEEHTLAVIHDCQGTHVLVCTRALSLVGLHATAPQGFSNDPERPWFGLPAERLTWSGDATEDPWLLVRKAVVTNSAGKTAYAQQDHLARVSPRERFPTPAEFCFAALLHLFETGERMCETHVVRFPVQSARNGSWVCVRWNNRRLDVHSMDGDQYRHVGSCSVRRS